MIRFQIDTAEMISQGFVRLLDNLGKISQIVIVTGLRLLSQPILKSYPVVFGFYALKYQHLLNIVSFTQIRTQNCDVNFKYQNNTGSSWLMHGSTRLNFIWTGLAHNFDHFAPHWMFATVFAVIRELQGDATWSASHIAQVRPIFRLSSTNVQTA